MCPRHHHKASDRAVGRRLVEDLRDVILPSSPTTWVKELPTGNRSYEFRRGYQILDVGLAKPVFRQIPNSISMPQYPHFYFSDLTAGHRPRIAPSSDTWLSSKIVPVARSKAARAFKYALWATTTVDLACAKKLWY